MLTLVPILTGLKYARDLIDLIQERWTAGHRDFPAETIGNDTLRENLERRAEAEAAVATDPTQPAPGTDPAS